MTLSCPGISDSSQGARESGLTPAARDVARGVGRLLALQGFASITEMALPNGRRTDMTAIGRDGEIIIIEIKVSRADMLGDRKWIDYLDYCDRFYWALPPNLCSDPLNHPDYLPGRCGLICGDAYDAAIVREAAPTALAPARRKAELLRFARIAAMRLQHGLDPGLAPIIAEGGR